MWWHWLNMILLRRHHILQLVSRLFQNVLKIFFEDYLYRENMTSKFSIKSWRHLSLLEISNYLKPCKKLLKTFLTLFKRARAHNRTMVMYHLDKNVCYSSLDVLLSMQQVQAAGPCIRSKQQVQAAGPSLSPSPRAALRSNEVSMRAN